MLLRNAGRRTVLTGAVAGLAASLSSRVARAAKSTVKVGVILPSSGVLAFPGQASVRGINFAAEIIRERGTASLEILHADTQSKPENGRIAAENLIRQGCAVLVGAWDSGATISAAQAAEAAKVPLVVNIATAPQITEQGFTQVFRNCPPASTIVRQSLIRLKELVQGREPAPASAVVMHINNTMGTATIGAVDKLWEELSMPFKIADRISYDERAKDLSVEVAKAKATGADVLLPITRVNDAILIVREMVKQRWSPKVVFSPNGSGPYEKAFTDALGKYSDGYLAGVPWYNPRDPKSLALVDRYHKQFPDQRFEVNVGMSFEALEIVADAVSRATSTEPSAIHAALRTTNLADHVMYGGPIQFDAKGQNNNVGLVLLQDRDALPIVVAPPEISQAEPQYPLIPYNKR